MPACHVCGLARVLIPPHFFYGLNPVRFSKPYRILLYSHQRQKAIEWQKPYKVFATLQHYV